jgi:orotate phosphoribosyltransferase
VQIQDVEMGERNMTGIDWKEERDALKAILLKNSVKFGEFILKSGKKSNYYIDARLTTLDPEGARHIGKLLFDRIHALELKPDVIGGMTMGADPMALATAIRSLEAGEPIQSIVVRKAQKDHGRKRRIEGNFKPGDRVVVVEDVGSTGGSVIEAIRVIREEGGEIVHVFLLVDRKMGAIDAIRAEGLSVEILFEIDELLENG